MKNTWVTIDAKLNPICGSHVLRVRRCSITPVPFKIQTHTHTHIISMSCRFLLFVCVKLTSFIVSVEHNKSTVQDPAVTNLKESYFIDRNNDNKKKLS